MDTVVVVTARDPKRCLALGALRAAGLRARPRRLDLDAAEIALEQADLVLIDVPDDRRVEPLVRPFALAPGMDETPIVLLVGPAGLGDMPALRLPGVVDFALAPAAPAAASNDNGEDGAGTAAAGAAAEPFAAEPFAIEIVARVRRALAARRRPGDLARVAVGGLLVDLEGYEVTREGEVLDLTYKEFELLKFLLTHPGRAFTRDELLARVWGYDYYGGSRTVDIHVRRIRAKVQHPYDSYIKTVRNVGYKWLAEPPHTATPARPPQATSGGQHKEAAP